MCKCGHTLNEHTVIKKICFGDYGSCDCQKYESENYVPEEDKELNDL